MSQMFFRNFTSPLIGLLAGSAFGLLFGWLASPHGWLQGNEVPEFFKVGAIWGIIFGVFIRVIDFIIDKKNIQICWKVGENFESILIGAILGGFVGTIVAAILGLVKILTSSEKIYVVDQILFIYLIPFIAMILGGVIGMMRGNKQKNNLLYQAITCGIIFGILSTIVSGILITIGLFPDRGKIAPIEFIALLSFLLLLIFIGFGLFSLAISVVSEILVNKLT